ncbi:MAG: hypothetical protein HY910_06625 [Desulfarculus sp.]|nr:hypothetical protein [Desulfarculus sp.]
MAQRTVHLITLLALGALVCLWPALWQTPSALAWTAGPTGWCTDYAGNNFPCGAGVPRPGGRMGPAGAMGAVGGMLVGQIMGMIVNEAMTNAAQDQQAAQKAQRLAQEKAQAEARAWAKARHERLELIARLRALRDAEESASLEQMSQALSDRWEGHVKDELTAALSDPSPVDLREANSEVPRVPGSRRPQTYQAQEALARLQGQDSQDLADEQAFVDFQQKMLEGRRRLDRSLEGLLKNVKEPPAPYRWSKQVDEGVILGLNDTPLDAQALMNNGFSPFTGQAYRQMAAQGKVMTTAFGSLDKVKELARGAADSLSPLNYTLSKEQAQEQIARLQGTSFKRLISYSNGATVSESLIQRGVIKVDEWHILAGDRVLSRELEFQGLLDAGKVQRVVVWVNRGDPVPHLIPPGHPLGRGRVEYRFFGDNYWVSLDKHKFNVYRDHLAQSFGVTPKAPGQ